MFIYRQYSYIQNSTFFKHLSTQIKEAPNAIVTNGVLKNDKKEKNMLARPKITAASNARNYFEMDTYYLNNEFEQGAFYGKLKEELGLDQFNLKDFDSLLKAQNPQTGEELLKLKNTDLDQNGDRKRAACDLTFAADKSISILYEVSDKETKKQIQPS